MGRLTDFVSKGVRLIVTDTTAAEPRRAPVEPLDAEALVREVAAAAPEPVAVSEVPADVSDFGAVYDEAGITAPSHGYGIEKVAEMLESKRLAPLAREVKSAAILAALEAAGVAIRDVIEDAVLRDQALDAFEAAKETESRSTREANEARIAAIRDEIEVYLRERNAEIEGLRAEAEASASALLGLQTRKRREEDRLHGVVAQFLEGTENPITTGAHAPRPSPPPADRTGE